jgi:hypothetical protein
MSDDATNEKDGGAQPPALDKAVQDHLGQKLRAAYAEVAEKPAFLGDAALPPEFEHKLLEVETAAQVREKGVEAIREVLDLPDPAREKGLDAVRDALGDPKPPRQE